MLEDVSVEQFIQMALEYNKENNITFELKKGELCPVHVFASQKNKPCMEVVSGIADCPLCHKPVCPCCFSHNVHAISRVTGYISSVSGWNEAKKEELKDRKRYNLR